MVKRNACVAQRSDVRFAAKAELEQMGGDAQDKKKRKVRIPPVHKILGADGLVSMFFVVCLLFSIVIIETEDE